MSPSTTTPPAVSQSDLDIDRKRSRKQLSLFFAGSAFALFSALITRRGVVRRINWARPPFFRRNMDHPEQQINGGLEALEALTVATVNVFSWSIAFTGGAFWALNLSSIEEMRQRLRVRLGLTEEEQKGSQGVVGEWIEAAKPWNSWKGALSKTKEDGSSSAESATATKKDSKTNERRAS